jgi:hypothetical protein
VHDDGPGGANFAHGTGLLGLKDRAEALGGRLLLHSPSGEGTTLRVTLPLDELGGPKLSREAEELPDDASLLDDASRGSAADAWHASFYPP